ncbi:DNA polymerase III subunit alpha [Leyella stercorea]|uniref:DNA polymerase III subunit alpha n=1 Tax=Leyella stercorea TaxID=363265 RepID=UPI00242FD195|nr:DNA polymerase III subunit alpha [Leyella stercorea]
MKKNRFVHLNVHSHYSIMDGCASIRELVDAAIKDKMLGIAITDNGNMSGVMEFFDYVSRINNERRQKGKKPFKAIIGCELYVAPGAKEDKKLGKHCNGHSLTVLAKNYQGYKNLIKIVSNSWTDGFYMRPRTDRADLEKYREGIIVLSGGIGSEVFTIFSDGDMSELDETIRWYRQTFAEDFYIELRRYADLFTSGSELQKITERLIEKADANGVKIVATNDVHYLRPTDIRVYNTLQSIAEGKTIEEYEKLNYPLNRWLRSRKEMCELFADIPAALDNTMEIFEKVEFYDIRHAPIVPSIDIPDGFGNERRTMEDNYLEYLSFSKANQIYGELLPEDVSERLKFELQIIKQRGASGYFLFLQDVVNTAQSELGVWVGPGRGSAAGSLVCYCLGITKIDPLKHDLLFERFLSPEGTMFPDIDIDFDDEGRKRVLEWLQQKYGKECCAHVVSFSTFSTANAFSTIAKAKQMLTPETMGVSELLSSHCGYYWHSIKDAIKYEPELRKLVRKAGASLRKAFDNTAVLERKIRGLGVHACGSVVADEPVSNWAPVSTCSIEDSKGNEKLVNCTQYDGWHVESSGLIKFDFLGLKTLSQMRDICASVKVHYDKDFDIEKIPMDDEKTMELFQTGQTDDVFQFTSKGMQKYLQKLHPTCFEDLVILNCMYRLGPMEYISTLVKHKNSKKAVKYMIPCLEKYLHNTYGIIIYQEQIMMLSRLIANFNISESDLLRKALGKREMDVLSVLKPRFIEGGIRNGYKKNALEKVWNEMETKGIYAFQKSHAVCYTWLAYQMAFLKANYPEEFKHVMEKCNTD